MFTHKPKEDHKSFAKERVEKYVRLMGRKHYSIGTAKEIADVTWVSIHLVYWTLKQLGIKTRSEVYPLSPDFEEEMKKRKEYMDSLKRDLSCDLGNVDSINWI